MVPFVQQQRCRDGSSDEEEEGKHGGVECSAGVQCNAVSRVPTRKIGR